jgi:hypothetical protein
MTPVLGKIQISDIGLNRFEDEIISLLKNV